MAPEAGGDIVPERNGEEQAAAGADQPPEIPDGEAAAAAQNAQGKRRAPFAERRLMRRFVLPAGKAKWIV